MSKIVKRPMGWIWWPAWTMIILLWLGQWAYGGLNWDNLVLGVITGCILVVWSVDMTIRAGRVSDL